MNITQRVKRLLGVGLVGAMVIALFPAGTAAADDHTISTDDVEACEDTEGLVEFNDHLGFFESEIYCMAAYGITIGDADGNYNTSGTVTRQHMALFIARFVVQAEAGTTDIPESTEDAFDDIADANPQEARHAVNFLAERDITTGVTEDTYDLGGEVTREQMASFIARAHDHLGAELPAPSDDDAFTDTDDVSDVHRDNILTLHAAGIVEGREDGSYDPGSSVTRGQMSAFIVRSIGLLEAQQLWNGEIIVDTPIQLAAPLLTSASVNVTTDTEVSVDYTFDEPVLGGSANIDADAFHLFSPAPNDGADNQPFAATATSTTRISEDTVRATFSTENAAFTSTISTVAGVSYGAVLDADGFHNPEGAVALNDVSFDDGTTLAPDLIDVTDLQVTGSDVTWFIEADFAFDVAATSSAPETAYFLIQADGQLLAGNATEGLEGDGTDTHTLSIGADELGTPFLTEEAAEDAVDEVVRGLLVADAVERTVSGNTFTNVEYTVDLDGGTDAPNLASISLDVDAGTADFAFDAEVDDGATASDFRLFHLDAGAVSGDAIERVDASTFRVEFGELQVNDLVVGAQTLEGAVTGSEGASSPDSVRLTTAFSGGEVAVSTLSSVSIEVGETTTDATTGEETVDGYVVTVSYDGPLTDATAGSHTLYQDEVDAPRFDLEASAAMDTEATSLEDGTIVFEVDRDTTAHADLFTAIDDGMITAAGVAYGGSEVEIARDDADLVLDTITGLVGVR